MRSLEVTDSSSATRASSRRFSCNVSSSNARNFCTGADFRSVAAAGEELLPPPNSPRSFPKVPRWGVVVARVPFGTSAPAAVGGGGNAGLTIWFRGTFGRAGLGDGPAVGDCGVGADAGAGASGSVLKPTSGSADASVSVDVDDGERASAATGTGGGDLRARVARSPRRASASSRRRGRRSGGRCYAR